MRTCVRVDKILGVSIPQVEEEARFVEVHELRVIVDAVEVAWIDRLGDRRVEGAHLKGRARRVQR